VFAQKLNAGEFAQQDFAIERLNDPDALSHLTTALAVELPLDVFGKVGAQAEREAAAGRSASADAREVAAELELSVVEAYWRADVSDRAVGVTERTLAGARAREADFEARVEQGASLNADLLRARARRRQREAELAERKGVARVALATLARLLGAAAETTYRPVDAPPPPPPLVGEEGDWTSRALERRGTLAAASGRLESAREGASAEHRGLLPDLVVYGQLQDDRNSLEAGRGSGTLGATVRWNAFDPSRSRRKAGAQADVRAAEQELRAAADQARLEVESAYRRALAARERYAAAAGGALEGREALRVIRERRQSGLATLTDELETEAASLAAELEEIEAAAAVAIADASLRRAAGETELPIDAQMR
jgi:outer membrane protein TolC